MGEEDSLAFVTGGSDFIRGLEWVAQDHDPEMTADDRGAYLREWEIVKGLLWHASVIVIDDLFQDVATLSSRSGDPDAWEDTSAISALPPRFGRYYDSLFAKKFLIAMSDVTAALANGWVELASVAHELAAHILLEHVVVPQETYEIELRFDLVDHLTDVLFEDRDFELLYSPRLDGFEDAPDPGHGAVNLDFASWFVPFNGVRLPAPYATKLPGEEV